MKNLLVVALNPCIDVEWVVDTVRPREKNSVLQERRWAGGKGINVARWLGVMGAKRKLFLAVGGRVGDELVELLDLEKIPIQSLKILGETRSNVIVTPMSGAEQYRFNPLGPNWLSEEVSALEGHYEELLKTAGCVVLSGSLPRGLGAGTYATLCRKAAALGISTVLDCDGPSLASGIDAHPLLVKPNLHELASWTGQELKDAGAILKAAWEMSKVTRGYVLVSCDADGAWMVHSRLGRVWRGRLAETVSVKNTVGAGDAMVAAVADQIAKQSQPEEWLRWGIAAGTEAVCLSAGILGSQNSLRMRLDQIQIEQLKFVP